jgi:hypothetical protein
MKEAIGYGINNNVTTGLKGILYLTGLVLFVKSLMPFKKASIYYSYYVLTPTVLVVFYFVHGIFLGLLSSFALGPIMPIQPDYNDGNIRVYSKFSGFLGRCCDYYATQDRLYIFEEFKGTIYTEGPVNFENTKVALKNDSVFIYSDSVFRVKLN